MTSNLSYWLEISFMLFGILIACQVFTNAIENLGDKLNLNHEFTGSILAAVGTALPETILPLVAIYMASQSHSADGSKSDIAIGAIVGAPFMLATLAMLLLGISIFLHRKQREEVFRKKFPNLDAKKISTELVVNIPHLKRDLKFFLITFSLAIFATFFGTSYVSHGINSLCSTEWGFKLTQFFGAEILTQCHDDIGYSLKIATSVILLLSYIIYLIKTYKASSAEIGDEEDDTPELYLVTIGKSKLNCTMKTVVAQTLIGLAGIIYFAHHFVESVDHIADMMQLSPLILSLIISPIATELPEKVNSWIWSSQGKDTLAMGNLSGAMVFQSAIPCIIGVLLTPWHLDSHVFLCSGLAVLSGIILLVKLELSNKIGYKTLLLTGLLYLVYLGLIFKV